MQRYRIAKAPSALLAPSVLQKPTDVETKAATIDTFCRRFGISRAFFYLLQKRGQGPRTMKLGRRVLISAEAAEEWRRQMERRDTAVAS